MAGEACYALAAGGIRNWSGITYAVFMTPLVATFFSIVSLGGGGLKFIVRANAPFFGTFAGGMRALRRTRGAHCSY